MHWVEKYAPLFGGDRQKYSLLNFLFTNSITVMGESAGASSIMHHLTAKSGNITLPFQKAIIQSPAFFPQYVSHKSPFADIGTILKNSTCNIVGSRRLQDVPGKTLSNVYNGVLQLSCSALINVKRNVQDGVNLISVLLLMGNMFVIYQEEKS